MFFNVGEDEGGDGEDGGAKRMANLDKPGNEESWLGVARKTRTNNARLGGNWRHSGWHSHIGAPSPRRSSSDVRQPPRWSGRGRCARTNGKAQTQPRL